MYPGHHSVVSWTNVNFVVITAVKLSSLTAVANHLIWISLWHISLKQVCARESWKCALSTDSHTLSDIHSTCMGNLEIKCFCAIKIDCESTDKKRVFCIRTREGHKNVYYIILYFYACSTYGNINYISWWDEKWNID